MKFLSIIFILILLRFDAYNQNISYNRPGINGCLIEIKKNRNHSKTKYLDAKSKNNRFFYFENNFDDTVLFYLNDSLITNEYFKTELSSGSTGKIIAYNNKPGSAISLKIIFQNNIPCKSIMVTIRKKIVKKYHLFFIYRTNDKFTILYSNYIPYYE